MSVQLVSKISNLCDPDPPTSQTDGQTDGQTDRRTDGQHAISIPRYALVHRAVKIESHLEAYNSDAQRTNLDIVPHSFVANFVSYISAKYFSFHTVIRKVIGVNFFETQCILSRNLHRIESRSILHRRQVLSDTLRRL